MYNNDCDLFPFVSPVNEKVQHVVALPADLKAHLDPIQLGGLEEFGGLEGPEEVSLSLSLGRTVMQGVQHVVLQKFLVAHPNLVNNICTVL